MTRKGHGATVVHVRERATAEIEGVTSTGRNGTNAGRERGGVGGIGSSPIKDRTSIVAQHQNG